MTIKIYTKNDKKLFLFVPGQPEYELIPTSLNHFSIKNLNGFSLEFLESTSKKIQEVKFIQPNGSFVAKKRT
jgi:hypothetical protein